MISEADKKRDMIQELAVDVDDDFIRRYFDFDSDKLLDEKIEVLTALKQGTLVADIPQYYAILELMPKTGHWD